jgi:hypothetical protein
MSIKLLQEKNKNIKIYDINSENFRKYGRVVEELNFEELYKYMEEKTSIPEKDNTYVASVEEMECMAEANNIKRIFYGEMPIQIGHCNGANSKLNGLEYHKGSEINAAVTDLVLLLGKVEDIDNNTYCSEKVEAFYLKRGTIVELYSTTLHFAPCKVQAEGFKCIVVLPKGTNLPLEHGPYMEASGEKRLLTAKNKWLICHPERKVLVNKGVYTGILGDNIEILF